MRNRVLNTLQSFLQNQLEHAPGIQRLVVGFSAGLDSTVLLHALARWAQSQAASPALLALHVHHGLSLNADAWEQLAQAQARALNIPFISRRVVLAEGASLEAQARAARYAAFREVLQPGDALLLAHHADDQAETLLFRLCRGAGVHGLGAMSACSSLALDEGGVALWRPLLTLTRGELEDYAKAQGLRWVEDESNRDTRYARNFLRQDILPALRQQWPAVNTTLAATAQRMQEANSLLAEYAELLRLPLAREDGSLSVVGLLALSAAQRQLVLRQQLQQQGLPLPEAALLNTLYDDVLLARLDAQPCLRWPGAECRRYRDGLYFMPPLKPVDSTWDLLWQAAPGVLQFPDGRSLNIQLVQGQGLSLAKLQAQPLRWAYRQGGEDFQPPGRPRRELKKLLQESAIPPWKRERLPLLWMGEELVYIPGLGMAQGWPAELDEQGLLIDL